MAIITNTNTRDGITITIRAGARGKGRVLGRRVEVGPEGWRGRAEWVTEICGVFGVKATNAAEQRHIDAALDGVCGECGQPLPRPPKAERWAADRALLARVKVKARAARNGGGLSWRQFAEWLGLDPTMGSPLAAVADGRRGLSADLRAALKAHDA